jgi:predicted RNA-binding protein YlqC (UPF0109 family)
MEAAKLLELIVKEMMDNPSAVSVNAIESRNLTILEVRVHPSEVGHVIGKQGYHAKALRSILDCIGAKERRRYSLEIIEPE